MGIKLYNNTLSFQRELATQSRIKSTINNDLPKNSKIEKNKIIFLCEKKTGIDYIARIFYHHSYIFRPDDLKAALKSANPDSVRNNKCIAGKTLNIPEPIIGSIENTPLKWPANKAVKAIYFQGGNVQPNRTTREVAMLKKRDVNGIVFDVKDIIGVVNYRSKVEQVEKTRRHRPPIKNIHKAIHFLHKNDIYVIARMALFQDENLATVYPKLAIKDASSPDGRLLVKGKPLWVDPGSTKVQQYNMAIVDELVNMGVDEIQFDYVRYPAEGNLKKVHYKNVHQPSHKTDHLVRFLSSAWLRTRMTNVKISIDIFGIVAWGEEVDVRATGQRIEKLARWVDIISPMLYPSHFNQGFDGFNKPADEGLHFYHTGVKKVLERSKSNPALVVRPWIQAFKWRVTNYNEQYIRDQIRGSYMGGGSGWLMWNAGNKYNMVYRALKNNHPEGKPDKTNRTRVTLD